MKLSVLVQALASTDRYSGSNRYSTATALANGFFGSADSVGFATGTNFPDSLVAGAHIGGSSVNGPLLLVKSTSVPKEVSDYLKTNGSRIMGGFVYGGTSAVSKSVQSSLESSL
jgi:putative cell wall-binding protein